MKKLLLAFFAMFFLIGCGDDTKDTGNVGASDNVGTREEQEISGTAHNAAFYFRQALKDISLYYTGVREITYLKSMITGSSKHFEDSALEEKVKAGKPIKFLVGGEPCAEMTLIDKGDRYIMETKDINKKNKFCKAFHNQNLYKERKTVLIGMK